MESELKPVIYITESEEGDLESGKRGRVLWLNFLGDNGNHSMINLNNLAHDKSFVIGKAMKEAIAKYESRPSPSKQALDEKELHYVWFHMISENMPPSVAQFIKEICQHFSAPIGLRLPERKDIEIIIKNNIQSTFDEHLHHAIEEYSIENTAQAILDEVIKLNTPTTKEGL